MHNLIKINIVLQIFDGILTYLGIKRFGIDGEGNPLVHILMVHMGTVLALVTVKTLAILSLIAVNSKVESNTIVKRGLKLSIWFYMLLAIIPWTVILYLTESN